MAKRILFGVVLLQIGVALSNEGLYRSLAELTAFLVLSALFVLHRQQTLGCNGITQSTES